MATFFFFAPDRRQALRQRFAATLSSLTPPPRPLQISHTNRGEKYNYSLHQNLFFSCKLRAPAAQRGSGGTPPLTIFWKIFKKVEVILIGKISCLNSLRTACGKLPANKQTEDRAARQAGSGRRLRPGLAGASPGLTAPPPRLDRPPSPARWPSGKRCSDSAPAGPGSSLAP